MEVRRKMRDLTVQSLKLSKKYPNKKGDPEAKKRRRKPLDLWKHASKRRRRRRRSSKMIIHLFNFARSSKSNPKKPRRLIGENL